jgi:hypothetical protein
MVQSSSGVQTCGNSWPWVSLNNVPAGSGDQVAQDRAFDVNGFHGVGLIGRTSGLARPTCLPSLCSGHASQAARFSVSLSLSPHCRVGGANAWRIGGAASQPGCGYAARCFGCRCAVRCFGKRREKESVANALHLSPHRNTETPKHRIPQAQPGGETVTDSPVHRNRFQTHTFRRP